MVTERPRNCDRAARFARESNEKALTLARIPSNVMDVASFFQAQRRDRPNELLRALARTPAVTFGCPRHF
jgi:hypothetical protein